MTIQVGERVPVVRFKQFGPDGLSEVPSDDFLANRRVLLFGIPGAFTPVCSGNHVPGYVARADAIRQQGIDEIACISVNDPFVMKAFGEAQGAGGKVTMLADSAGEFAAKTGLAVDGSSFGLGQRSTRYAMVINDGVVERLMVEGHFVDHDVSSADSVLRQLREG